MHSPRVLRSDATDTLPLTHQLSLMSCAHVATAAFPDARVAARLFHALSDETRLAILALLQDGEQCVCDLQSAIDAAQSRLSFHLRVLRDAGMVTDRKEGRWSRSCARPEDAPTGVLP